MTMKRLGSRSAAIFFLLLGFSVSTKSQTQPTITAISPSGGAVGTWVTVTGTNFGATQAAVTFNGVTATPISWGATSIVVPAPSGATTGSVVVSVSGQASNGVCFAIPAVPCGTFTASGSLNIGRSSHTATLLNSGMVLITGGRTSSGGYVSTAELYNPATRSFVVTGSMAIARATHTATLLNSGLVLIAGGNSSSSFYLSSAELYNPATGAFTATGSMNTPRQLASATLLNNGLVLIAGGTGGNGIPGLVNAELYNPATGTFSVTGSLNVGRTWHTATLLNNGMVLVAGGWNNSGNLSSAELYNPSTGTFTITGSLGTARHDHSATLLKNGMVLVSGGRNSSSLSSAELYNPATGTFSVAGSFNTARYLHSATLLNDGMVLVAGGLANASDLSSFLSSAELCDPAAGTFSFTSGLNTSRAGHTATLLSSGTTLAIGGTSLSNGTAISLASSEAYNLAVPIITSLSPTSGPVGTSVVITGTGFGATQSTSTVAFNGTTATPLSWSGTSVVAPVPPGAATGNVVVTVGGFSSSGQNFTVTSTVAAPSITSLSPSSGPVGTAVTIAGANFGSTRGTSTVKFNGTAATPTSWGTNSITVPVPTGATTGNVVVTVGGLSSNAVLFTLAPATLQITSPANGTVFAPGQSFSVSVAGSPNIFSSVMVVPHDPFDMSSVPTPLPGSVSYAVPSQIAGRSYSFTAVGVTNAGQTIQSAPISINVQRSDLPTSISTPLSGISFSAPGETSPFLLLATFADGSVLDATRSTSVAYSSTNAAVAVIDTNGIVTAVSPGTASVTAVYTVAAQSVTKSIPVTVDTPSLNPSVYSVSYGVQVAGTTSSAQSITLTNLTSYALPVISLNTTGDFSETDNCLSASPLPAGGTCVVNIRFTPSAVGARAGKLVIVNKTDIIPTAVALTGSGQ